MDHLRFRLGFGLDAFSVLIRKITWVGSPALPATNTSTGTRKSLDPFTADRGVNEVDQWTRSGIPMISSLAAATNLVSATGTDWEDVVAGGSVDLSRDHIDVTQTLPADRAYARYYFSVVSGETYTLTVNISINTTTAATDLVRFITPSDDMRFSIPAGATGIYNFTLPSTATSSTGTIIMGLGVIPTTNTGLVRFEEFRIVNSSAPAAPFPDGSAAGTSVGVDLVSCTPTWGASGTIVQAVTPYGWNSAGGGAPINPLSTRFFQADSAAAFGSTGITADYGTPTISTGDTIVDGLQVFAYDWTTGVGGWRYDSNVRKTVSGTITAPSGTMYIGNNTATTVDFHGALVTGIVPWVLSDAEYEILRVGLQNLFGGQVLQ